MNKNIDAWSFKTFADAERAAIEESSRTGQVHLAADRGANVWPRYDVVAVPALGDDVSESFNGDSYPVGKVEQIGKNYKMIKAGGRWFYRVRLTGAWRAAHSPFCLIQGTHHEWNREF